MNWKQFKEKVEREGVTDDMEVGFIDVDYDHDMVINIEGNSFNIDHRHFFLDEK